MRTRRISFRFQPSLDVLDRRLAPTTFSPVPSCGTMPDDTPPPPPPSATRSTITLSSPPLAPTTMSSSMA